MFKKKPQIKNLSPLRSSDRRKLADQIIADYKVPVSNTPASEASESTTSATQNTNSPPTLTSLRASLVPESTLSARFTTHSGANATLVSGTIYVGAHPGQEERILWLSYGKDPRLYPTVYTLWQNAGLVPLLHTLDFVVEKLKTGADLMTPGLAGGPPWPEGAKEGSVVAVAGLGKESVPVWVGVCKIDVSGLGRVQGLKGAAVEGIHWVGDELWTWSQNSVGGREAPQRIEGWDDMPNVESLDIEEDEDEAQEDGGVALHASTKGVNLEHTAVNGRTNEEGEEEEEPEPQYEPTTAEVDEAFQEAFLYAAYNARKSGSPPHYGINIPILPSYLIANIVQPHLRYQEQQYTIKKTSWKNVKKFIQHLDKQQIVKSKTRGGHEIVIFDIDFDDDRIKNFTPYRLPKPKSTNNNEATSESTSSPTDPSLNQTLSLTTVYRPTPRLVPTLLPSKTHFYTSTQITSAIKTYITSNPTLTTLPNKRNITLDPFLANTILHNASPQFTSIDTTALSTGQISRDTLAKRILDDTTLLSPFYLLLRNSDISTFTPDHPEAILAHHKPKAYPPPRITLTLEKRTGNKTITRIAGLEQFNINPNIFGPELQRKCAGSASVGQLMGGKPGVLEVTVQGDQRDVVTREVGRRGVRGEWVGVVDKTKKGKK